MRTRQMPDKHQEAIFSSMHCRSKDWQVYQNQDFDFEISLVSGNDYVEHFSL